MNKCKRMGLWTSITCGFLAGIMGFTSPLEIKAAAQGAYLSDVIVITKDDITKARNDGYTVMNTALGEQALRDKEYNADHTKTYLAYKTTNKVSEAIRDMKFMNMNGGFDFAKYDQYLDDLESETNANVSHLFSAVEGYRKYYTLRTKQGLFAHDALNVFRYDENDGLSSEVGGDLTKENAVNMRLGDLLLDETLVSEHDFHILTEIFMEGNSYIVDSIYSSLNIANIKDDDGKTVFDRLEEVEGNYAEFADRTDLNGAYAELEGSLIKIREDIDFYENEATCKLEDFKNSDESLEYTSKLLEQDFINQTNHADMWNDAIKEINFLKNIPYKGLSGKYESLLDVIKDEEADSSEYYPLLGCMTPGVRGTILTGLMDVFNNSILDENEYTNSLNGIINSDEYTEQYLKDEGVSVFFDVDRTLFQKGNVAMTTSAQEGAAKGENDWMQVKNIHTEKDEKIADIIKYVSIGLGGITFLAGVGWLACKGAYSAVSAAIVDGVTGFNGEVVAIDQSILKFCYSKTYNSVVYARQVGVVVEDITEAQAMKLAPTTVKGVASRANDVTVNLARQSGLALSKLILAIGVVIAFIALIVSIVLYVFYAQKEKEHEYNKYQEIPGILCHRQPVFEVTNSSTLAKAKDQGYVYYYGATNPYGVATKAKYGEEDNGTFELGENKRNVQDIFNWELGQGKSREWVCLYYTKDAKANHPITTSSLKILGEVGSSVAGATYFNKSDIEYNVNSVLVNNYYDDDRIASRSIKEVNAKYLRFNVDSRAKENSKIGSVVSNPATWGFVLLGLAVGFGGGFLTFHFVDKKRKTKKAA